MLDIDVVRVSIEHSFGTWRFQRDWKEPLHIKYGEGPYLYDKRGKKYLDFTSQLACVNLGYGNKRVINAIKETLEKISYLSGGYVNEIRSEAAEALFSILPTKFQKFMASSSGSEANEDALKIIRTYKFPKFKIMTRYSSYHGNTAAAISMTGDPRRIFVEYHTNVRGTIFLPDPDPYRCPFKGVENPHECAMMVADYIEYMVENEGNIAAIIFETITGTNKPIVLPKEFYKRVKRIADKHDILLMFDEVMSGWGRTGEWFAFQHYDVTPDVMTTAKGATSSYFPLGLTVVTKEIADYFEDHFLPVGHTYAYNLAGLAAMKAVIEEYKERNLLDHVKKMGRYLGEHLNGLKERHKSVGYVGGIGLFWALEIVKNRRTKEPFNTKLDKIRGIPFMTAKIANKMREMGVLQTMNWISHFVIAPPLIVTEEDIDWGINAFDEALKIADAEVEE
jgi:taurine--2-oxoglutarate transaminase